MEIFHYLQDPGISRPHEIFKDGVQLREEIFTTPDKGTSFIIRDPQINVLDLKGRIKSEELEYQRQSPYDARFSTWGNSIGKYAQ
jgi:hypothetical protein